jgi:transitional endoplasmic reticulum ATPase
MTLKRGLLAYLIGSLGILIVYSIVAVALYLNRDFNDKGSLSFHQPALKQALPEAISIGSALDRCFPPLERDPHAFRYKVVGGLINERPYYACYEIDENGSVFDAWVINGRGDQVRSVSVIKKGGAWPWIGVVKSGFEFALGGLGLAACLYYAFLYYRKVRPGPPLGDRPWWIGNIPLWIFALTPLIGWVALALIPRVSRARKVRIAILLVPVYALFFFSAPFFISLDVQDPWGITVTTILLAGAVFGAIAAKEWVAPYGFGAPEDLLPEVGPISLPAAAAARPAGLSPVSETEMMPEAAMDPKKISEPFKLQRPESLHHFSDVGGMEKLKAELKETFGFLLAFFGEAEAYKITWNGILLHGPPGVGKTFIAKAVAGEFGLNFIHISTGDLVSAYRGESSRNVQEAFRFAARNVPCVLFFDEFDSIAQSREDWPDQEARRTVNQLLQSLEEYRPLRELVVMAATNDLEALDPAVVRPGRFDRHIRIDLPDAAAREAILRATLRGRPLAGEVDSGEFAQRSSGLTPAAITQVVQMASLAAFREAASSGHLVKITMDHLLKALEERGGEDRPTMDNWTWESLVLSEDVKMELQQLQALVENPETARAYGIQPLSGILLTGPPGTGKTTIAKVLAAQAKCSFYPISAGDITSMWLGESEKSIQQLFRRARDNRPSIVFIDEIDAIASKRGEWGSYDRQINELLQEIDGIRGQEGVFVIAATNRPDKLDPALLRGGRLSRTIEIPLPDHESRLEMLRLMTERMPTVAVDLKELAGLTDGFSGADLKALCQQAAIVAMIRGRKTKASEPATAVLPEDFKQALDELRESKALSKSDMPSQERS